MVEVGCAGILVADTFCGPMKALPTEGHLLAIDNMVSTVGGCAANVACALGKQQVTSAVCGCVGNDPGAKIVADELLARGVDCSYIQATQEAPTSQTIILIIEGQDRRYIHVFGANERFAVEHVDRHWVAKL